MSGSHHSPGFLRVSFFVITGAFTGAATVFALLFFIHRNPREGLLGRFHSPHAPDLRTRELTRRTEILQSLLDRFEEQLERDRALIAEQQALLSQILEIPAEETSQPVIPAALAPHAQPSTESPPPSIPPISAPHPAKPGIDPGTEGKIQLDSN